MTRYGKELSLGAYRGAVDAALDTPGLLAALADPAALAASGDARVLLDGRNRVVAVPVPGPGGARLEAVLKVFRASGFKRLKTLVVPGKAAKAWTGASACHERAVPTPLPMAYLERRTRLGIVEEGYYLSALVPGAVEIRSLLRELPPDALDRLLAVLARLLVLCHNEGILHRDLSDGNVLVRPAGPGGYDLWLIDTNRVRVRRSLSMSARLRNLVRLGVPPDYRDRFLRLYLGEANATPSRLLWYRANKACYAGFVSLKKKLRLRRLAERLGIQ